ncbi:MAG: hypothetical protein AB7N71_12400 [Phycisphaerae bacterium]
MLASWRNFHRRHVLLRFAVKSAILLVVAILILFPRFWLLPQWAARWSNPEDLIDPHHPGLAQLEQTARRRLQQLPAVTEREVFATAEQVVLEAIPYEYDWNNSGQVDHLPTVDEVFAAGVDDCDGEAIVIASLLRRMGYQASLVTDFLHVWVQGPEAEALSIGGTPSVTMHKRPAVRVDPQMFRNLTKGTLFGIRIFPATRQLVLIAAILLLAFHPRASGWRIILGSVLFVAGWLVLRQYQLSWSLWIPAACFLAAIAGLILILWRRRVATG